MIDYVLLGTRIRSERLRKGLTQETLAELVDLCVPYVSHIERGGKKPSLKVIVDIATALGTTVDHLLTGNQGCVETAYMPDVEAMLEGCSIKERKLILEVVKALKMSLRSSGLVA